MSVRCISQHFWPTGALNLRSADLRGGTHFGNRETRPSSCVTSGGIISCSTCRGVWSKGRTFRLFLWSAIPSYNLYVKIFDGRAEAKKLDEKILEFVAKNPAEKVLAIVQIGDNASSEKYVEVKKRVGEKLGIEVVLHKFGAETDDLELIEKTKEVFEDEGVGGVIVQLPLPRPSLNAILDLVPAEKDIDCLSSQNADGVLTRLSPAMRACEYFIYSDGEVSKTKRAIVVGGGKLVGKPISNYLESKGWKVEIDENYARGKVLNAQLVVLSAGIPNLVAGEDISDGANVIDFGSSVVDGKTVGDLDMKTGLEHLGLLSPSPGGMGPLTVRYLFMNFLGI